MVNQNMQNDMLLERAKAAVLSRDYNLAAKLYRGLLRSEPENIELLGALADAYVKSGNDENAIPLYKELIRIDKNNVRALNDLGGVYRRLKRYDDSIAVLEQAIIENENNIQTFYNLGFTYKLMGKYDDALLCFKNVIDENPKDVLAYNHLGAIYALQGKTDDAVNAYKRGLVIDANHPVLHLNLAKTYKKLGEWEKAAKEFEAALRTKPGWLEAIENYTDLLVDGNRTQEAEGLMQKAISLNPNNAHVHAKMGKVYARQKNFDSAENEFNVSLKLDADNTETLSLLADTYEAAGKNAEAVKTMTRVEELIPEDIAMLKRFARILLSANKINSASQKIKKVWQHNPEDVQALNLLGQYYVCSGEDEKAADCFERIKKINADYADFYRDAARRYSQKGNYRQAETLLDKYISAKPNDTIAMEQLAETYEKQGKFSDALKQYRKISGLDAGNKFSSAGEERMKNKIIDSFDSDSAAVPPVSSAGAGMIVPDENMSVWVKKAPVAEEVAEPAPKPVQESAEEPEKRPDEFSELKENDSDVDAFSEGALDEADKEYAPVSPSLDSLVEDTSDEEDSDDGVKNELDDFFTDNPFERKGTTGGEVKEDDFDLGFEKEDILNDDDVAPASFDLDEDSAEPATFDMPEKKTEPQNKTKPVEDSWEPEPVASAPEKTASAKPAAVVPAPAEDIAEPAEEIFEPSEAIAEPAPAEDIIEPAEDVFESSVDIAEPAPAEDIAEPAEEIFEPSEDIAEPAPAENIAEPAEDVFEPSEDIAEPAPAEDIAEPAEDVFEPSEDIAEPAPTEDIAEPAEDVFEPSEDIAEPAPAENIAAPAEDIAEPADFIEETPETLSENSEAEVSAEDVKHVQQIIDTVSDEVLPGEAVLPAELFVKLKALSEYLPEDKKQSFLESKKRLQLDYIISRLEGKTGLLKTAMLLRSQMQKEESIPVEISGTELLVTVLREIQPLVMCLEDESLSEVLCSQIDSIIERVL